MTVKFLYKARKIKVATIPARFLLRFLKREPSYIFFSPPSLYKILRKGLKSSVVNLPVVKDVVLYENVISYPVTAGGDNEIFGGLLNSQDGSLIKEALLGDGGSRQEMPGLDFDKANLETVPVLKGTYLYAGMIFNNFGHFLLESISRLWACQYYKDHDLFIIVYAPWGRPQYLEKDNYINQVLRGFGIPLKKLLFFTDIVLLKKVLIPEQKYGFEICKHPEPLFVDFIRSFKFPLNIPTGFEEADKVYVSRSDLPLGSGKPLGEKEFERYLAANGYLIFYPENYTIYEQLTVYKRAKQIIFCDGGAIHSCILLPDLKAAVAIVARRRDLRWNCREITAQFLGYNKQVLWIDEVKAQYQFGLETWNAIGEIDWYKVGEALKQHKFVTSDFQLTDPIAYKRTTNEELQLYIKSIADDKRFVEFMTNIKEQYPIVPNSF